MAISTIRISRNTLLAGGFDDDPGITDTASFMCEVIKNELADAEVPATVTMNSHEMSIDLDTNQLADAIDAIGKYYI